jgi:hypothetical protein
MLARGIAVRHTIDIDIYRAARWGEAERGLRGALELDAGTGCGGAGHFASVADGAAGLRVPVVVAIGATTWVRCWS